MTPLLAAVVLITGGDAVTTPAPGSKLRVEILDTWRALLKKDLRGKSILFKVDWMKTDGTWAFVNAETLQSNGRPMDWRGTAYEEQQKEGMMDQMSQLLLKKVKGKWTKIEMVMGPTDVAWIDWFAIHKAPKAIFPLPEQLRG